MTKHPPCAAKDGARRILQLTIKVRGKNETGETQGVSYVDRGPDNLLCQFQVMLFKMTSIALSRESIHINDSKKMSLQIQPQYRERRNQQQQHEKFQINNLPLELYLHILSHLSSFSETLAPSLGSLHLPIHLPFAAPLFYSSLLFTFSCLDVLRQFAGHFERGRDVRRVRILYDADNDVEGRPIEGNEESKKGDWVFVLFESFQKLEEITFVKTVKMNDGNCFEDEETWWQHITNAVREGLAMRNQTGGIVVKLEDGRGWAREEKIVYT
ncbi:hypothetical protein PVAG01_10598 [Phlyctema vagabunda]|uniref:F-box domain-containing protein n=1 Tax=Phlyctema vagabunda TaxID=108571 RepID=A0ABR4P2P7_9HELO